MKRNQPRTLIALILSAVLLLAALVFASPAGAQPYTWDQLNDDGFGFGNNIGAFSAVVYKDQLYVGTRNDINGCRVYRYDGVDP